MHPNSHRSDPVTEEDAVCDKDEDNRCTYNPDPLQSSNQVGPGLSEDMVGNEGHDNPKFSSPDHSHSDICKPGPRCLQRIATQSAAGAAMKGVPHTSRLKWTIEEVCRSTRHTQDTENVSHIAVQTWWVLLSPNSEECTMLSSDTDPKTWREAMAADDAPDWIEGLKEEMASLRAHNVFTLVPRHPIPTGFCIIKSRPHCH